MNTGVESKKLAAGNNNGISRLTIGYLLLLAVTVAGFLLVRYYGETEWGSVATSDVAAGGKAAAPAHDLLWRVLIALTAVIVLGQVLGRLFALIQQPPVIGEVIAGILLGPSLLGEETSKLILPPTVAPLLGVIAQIGVILYMFIVGLELNLERLKSQAHATIAISHASILVPFLMGSLLSLYLYPRLSSSDVNFTSFALFIGVSMSITAFPVLARILTDRKMTQTDLGIVALSCAATDDVTAWCLLAFVVGIVKSEFSHAIWVGVGTLGYMALMYFCVRPVVKRIVQRWDGERLSRGNVALVVVALLLSALATETIGIHAIFGAFLLGAIIPHDSSVARTFTDQIEQVVTVLFLPAFFALTGMRTRIDLLSGSEPWLICGLIILIATFGKFGGTVAAARFTGVGWRNAAALGTLMNTRGLMELIVLNIGLDLGVISPTLFAMMVLMALVTTMITSPVLRVLLRPTSEASL